MSSKHSRARSLVADETNPEAAAADGDYANQQKAAQPQPQQTVPAE